MASEELDLKEAQRLRKIELHKPGNMVPIPLRAGESKARRKSRLEKNWADADPSLWGAGVSGDKNYLYTHEIVTYCEVSREELEEDLVDRVARELGSLGDVVEVSILDVQIGVEEGILLYAQVEVEG